MCVMCFELKGIMAERFGPALVVIREARGYKSQAEVSEQSASAVKKFPTELQKFSQQWLSKLESDKTGEKIGRSQMQQLRCLSYLLGMSGDDFEELVGISIGRVPSGENEKTIDSTSSELPEILRYTIVILEDMETQKSVAFPRELLRRNGDDYQIITINPNRLMDDKAREKLQASSHVAVDIDFGGIEGIKEGNTIVAEIAKKQLVIFTYDKDVPIVVNQGDRKHPKIIPPDKYKIIGVCEVGYISLR